MADISTIIEKVKKLLALSKSSNANEAAAAAAMANKLIDQHRLSIADLDDGGVDEALEEDEEFVYTSKSVTAWKYNLLMDLAEHYGLAVINHPRTRYTFNSVNSRKESRYRLIGRRSDIQLAKYMFAWLSSECVRIAANDARGRGRKYVASWCLGFVEGVREKLASSREEAKKTATSSAIVKIDSRLQESMDFMKRSYENLKVAMRGSNVQHDPLAWHTGKQKGRSINMGNELGAPRAKLLR